MASTCFAIAPTVRRVFAPLDYLVPLVLGALDEHGRVWRGVVLDQPEGLVDRLRELGLDGLSGGCRVGLRLLPLARGLTAQLLDVLLGERLVPGGRLRELGRFGRGRSRFRGRVGRCRFRRRRCGCGVGRCGVATSGLRHRAKNRRNGRSRAGGKPGPSALMLIVDMGMLLLRHRDGFGVTRGRTGRLAGSGPSRSRWGSVGVRTGAGPTRARNSCHGRPSRRPVALTPLPGDERRPDLRASVNVFLDGGGVSGSDSR